MNEFHANEHPFQRTTCACEKCVECCKHQPGMLVPRDIGRIADHLGLSIFELSARYLRKSPGALVGNQRTGEAVRIGTIVPAPDATGRCVFLGENDRCQIHKVAPFGCAMFDRHQTPDEYQPRVWWSLVEISSCEPYQMLRSVLEPAAIYRPGFE